MSEYLAELAAKQLRCENCKFAAPEFDRDFPETFICNLMLPPWVAATSNGPRRVESYESCSLGFRRD